MDFRKVFDLITDTGLVFLIIFTPLAFGSVHIWAYTLMELVVFSLLIVWVVKYLIFSENRIERALMPIYISFLLFLVIVSLQTLPLPPDIIKTLSPKAHEIYSLVVPEYQGYKPWWRLSIYPYATKIYLIKFFAYIGIFFLITHEIREKKRIERLIITLMLVGIFEALYGLYGYFSKDYYIFGFKKIYGMDSATGTFINRNHFAGYLGMVIPVSIGYLLSMIPRRTVKGYGFKQKIIDFLDSPQASKGWLIFVTIITMMLGVIFSLSRMGVFSFVVSILFMIFISAINRQRKLRNLILSILFIGLTVSLWYGIEPLIKRYYSVADSLANDRTIIWSSTLKLIKEFPLTGTGIGTYETVFQRYKPIEFKGVIYTHAHNDYLELLSEAGIIGLLPVFIGVIYFFILILKKWTKRRDPLARGIPLGGMGALVYILLHSITDFNMHIPANALTLFIIMAITYRSITIKRRRGEENKKTKV